MPLSPYSIDPSAPLGPLALRGLDSPQADMSSLDAAAAFMKAHPEFAKAGPAGDGTTAGQGDPNAPTGGPVTPPFLDRVGAAARQGPPQLSAEMVRSAINSARHAGGASDSPDTLLPSIAGVAPYFAAAPAMMGFHAGQAATDMDENPGRLAPDAISLALASLPAAAGTKVGGAVMDALQSPAARQAAAVGTGGSLLTAAAMDQADAGKAAQADNLDALAAKYADNPGIQTTLGLLRQEQKSGSGPNAQNLQNKLLDLVQQADGGIKAKQAAADAATKEDALAVAPFAKQHPNIASVLQGINAVGPAVAGLMAGRSMNNREGSINARWGSTLDDLENAQLGVQPNLLQKMAGSEGIPPDPARAAMLAKTAQGYEGRQTSTGGQIASELLPAMLGGGIAAEARGYPFQFNAAYTTPQSNPSYEDDRKRSTDVLGTYAPNFAFGAASGWTGKHAADVVFGKPEAAPIERSKALTGILAKGGADSIDNVSDAISAGARARGRATSEWGGGQGNDDIKSAIDGLPDPVKPDGPVGIPYGGGGGGPYVGAGGGNGNGNGVKQITGPKLAGAGGPGSPPRRAAANDMLDAYASGTPSERLTVPDSYGFSPAVAGTVADRTRSAIDVLQKNGSSPANINTALKDLIARGIIKPAVAVGAGTAASLAPQQDDSSGAISARLAPRLMGQN